MAEERPAIGAEGFAYCAGGEGVFVIVLRDGSVLGKPGPTAYA